MQHKRGGGIHPQSAGRMMAAQHQRLFRFFRQGDNPSRPGQIGLPLLAQRQAPGGAVHQGGLQFFLQPAKNSAGGGNRLVQALGRSGNGPAVGNGDKGEHFVERCFHI